MLHEPPQLSFAGLPLSDSLSIQTTDQPQQIFSQALHQYIPTTSLYMQVPYPTAPFCQNHIIIFCAVQHRQILQATIFRFFHNRQILPMFSKRYVPNELQNLSVRAILP